MEFSGSVIKNKTFEKNFRGYDKDEVEQFLEQLADAFDQVQRENKYLLEKIEQTEKEAHRLKEVEASLFRALKTAEDTGAAIIEEANAASDEILNEAKKEAIQLVDEANFKATQIIEEAEVKAKDSFDKLKNEAFSFIKDYNQIIEQRVVILEGLKKLHQGLEKHINSSEQEVSSFDGERHQKLIDDLENTFGDSISKIKEEKVILPTAVMDISPEIEKEAPTETYDNEPFEDEFGDLTIDELMELSEEDEDSEDNIEEVQESPIAEVVSEEFILEESEDFENTDIEEEEKLEIADSKNPTTGDSITWRNEIQVNDDDKDIESKKDKSFFDELD
jgi:cell division initiation protein